MMVVGYQKVQSRSASTATIRASQHRNKGKRPRGWRRLLSLSLQVQLENPSTILVRRHATYDRMLVFWLEILSALLNMRSYK